MAKRVAERPHGEDTEYNIYPKPLQSPYADRRFEAGENLYGALGIRREDKVNRRLQFNRNFQLFGAPVGLFCYIHRGMGPPQWSDLGMYLQSLMLLAVEEGLATCAQECWSLFPKTVAKHVAPPAELMLFCGMAIGYEDPIALANKVVARRAQPSEFAS